MYSNQYGSASNTYVVTTADGYQIYNADGVEVGPAWGNMGPKQNGAYYQVLNGGSISMMAADGTMVLPENYFGFVSPGEGWMLGIIMEETTDANPDYTSRSGQAMNVLRVDVVRGNELIGTLTREQYVPTATAGLIGDYLYILHADGRCLWFNSALEQTAQTVGEPEEYTLVDGAYIHTPTQQQAFVSTCTLTASEVEQAAMIVDDKLVDLQGNMAADLSGVRMISTDIKGNYLYAVTLNGEGVWNLQGQVLIPDTYARVASNAAVGYFPNGYQAAINEEGLLTFIDESGAVSAQFDVPMSQYSYEGYMSNSPIMALDTGNGYTIITATHGQLSEIYDNVDIGYSAQPIICVEKNGLWGCIDMAGEVVVPFVHTEAPTVSDDGTLVWGENADGSATIYHINY